MTRLTCRGAALAAAAVTWSAAGAAQAEEPQTPPSGVPPLGAPASVSGVSGGADLLDRNRADRAPPVLAPARPTPAPAPAAAVLTEAPAHAAFTVTDVRVDGATAPRALVRTAVAPFTGRRLDANGAGAIADALAAAYAQSDVAISTVLLPRQSFDKGVVRLRVIEGRLEGVDVTSRDPRLVQRAKAITAPLLTQTPMRKSSFDRALLLLQSMPGAKVEAAFVRGARTGSVRLTLKIKVRRLKGGVGISDRGQNLLGRTQISLVTQLNSALRAGDQTTLILAVPTVLRRFQYVAVSHSTPIGADGPTATLSLGHISTHPRGYSTSGEATIGSLQASWPVILSAKRSLTLTGSLDGLDSRNAFLGQTLTNERTRALRFAAAFTQSFAAGQGSATLGATLSQGIDGLGARVLTPGYAHPDFRKLTVQAAAVRRFGKWTVRLRATGQAVDGTAPSSEQITLGGDDFGRAFEAGSATGDAGAAGSLEIAYVPKLPAPIPDSLEAYIFTDAGRARTFSRPALGLAGRTDTLASVGFGARFTVAKHTALQLEAAHALIEDTPYAHGDDWRLIVGVRSSY